MLKQVISFVTMFTVFPTVAFAQSDVSTDVTKAEIDTVYEKLGTEHRQADQGGRHW